MDYRNLVLLATMGLAVICNSLQEATHRKEGKPTPEASRAIAFLQGTGLDLVIQRFGLDLDADHLRRSFFRIANR